MRIEARDLPGRQALRKTRCPAECEWNGRCSEWSWRLLRRLGGLSRDGPAVGRIRQAEIAAQGRVFVFGAEQAAVLQLGDDQFNEIVEAGRQPGRQDVETISGFVFEPFLQCIDDDLGGADDGEMPARRGDPLIKLADGKVVLVGNLADKGLARFHALGGGRRWQWAVEIIAREVERAAGQSIEEGNAVFLDDKAGEAIILFL